MYTPILFMTILTLTFHLCLGLPSGLLPFDFPTYALYAFLSYPTHLILFDFVNLITSRSEYTSLSTEARVRFQVSPCGICDGGSGDEGVSPSISLFPSVTFHKYSTLTPITFRRCYIILGSDNVVEITH